MTGLQKLWLATLLGALIGLLGGLIGLGGAEFRLPILVAVFSLPTLEAIILNKAMSLVVVITSIFSRGFSVPMESLLPHWSIVINLLIGSVVGAWYAAGYVMKLAPAMLNRVVFGLLIALALIMFWEHLVGFGETGAPLFQQAWLQALVGILAGLVVGIVAAVLGVAGGELLIPIIVILWGIDIKTAGSLSLLVSLPTMLVGFFRYRQAQAFDALRRERDLLIWMSVGSIAGALVGGLMLGLVPAQWLGLFLAVLLLISAWKVFKH
jgi:uncharacterized membrane protein YfcA